MTARTLVLTALASVALVSPASAADFNVSTTTDELSDGECTVDCTLRDAVGLAGPADRVVVPSGTYVLTEGQLTLAGDTIDGASARTTTIDADDDERVFDVASGTNAISDLTLTGGSAHGTAPMNGIGGGIVVAPAAELVLLRSTLAGNSALQGGGIGSLGTLTVQETTITDNVATAPTSGSQGGGIWSAGTTSVINSTISANRAIAGESQGQGGGIYVGGGSLTTQNVTIAANQALFGDVIVRTQFGSPTVTFVNTIVDSASGGPFRASAPRRAAAAISSMSRRAAARSPIRCSAR